MVSSNRQLRNNNAVQSEVVAGQLADDKVTTTDFVRRKCLVKTK